MTRLVADVARLDELVAELAAFERRLEDAHAEVGACMHQLHLRWSGGAAVEQAAAHRRWTAAAAQMQGALATLRRAAAISAANYRAAVSAGRQMWSR